MLFDTATVDVEVVEGVPADVLSLASVDDLLPPLQEMIKKEATNDSAIKIFFIC